MTDNTEKLMREAAETIDLLNARLAAAEAELSKSREPGSDARSTLARIVAKAQSAATTPRHYGIPHPAMLAGGEFFKGRPAEDIEKSTRIAEKAASSGDEMTDRIRARRARDHGGN